MNNFSNADSYNEADQINITAIFSEFKRIVQSKNFKGGNITILFGGAKLYLSHADINTAIIDISQAFGEVKLSVPEGWYIKSDITPVFSTVTDKRKDADKNFNSGKVLVLKGFSIFGHVEIRTAKPPEMYSQY